MFSPPIRRLAVLPLTWDPLKDMRQFIGRRTENATTYPMHAGPMRMKAVPPNAEAARKTINEARLGANAVARLSKKNMAEEDKAAYRVVSVSSCCRALH
jgi:hypothetical protein